MIDEKIDFRVNMLGLAYMILAFFENGYARFACFALFIASYIILKDEAERLFMENYRLNEKINKSNV